MTPVQSWAMIALLFILIGLLIYIALELHKGASFQHNHRQAQAEVRALDSAEALLKENFERFPPGSVIQWEDTKYLIVMVGPNRIGLQDYWDDVYHEFTVTDLDSARRIALETLTTYERTAISRCSRKYLYQ